MTVDIFKLAIVANPLRQRTYLQTLNDDIMTKAQKIHALHDWITHMDECAMDELLIEYLGFDPEQLENE